MNYSKFTIEYFRSFQGKQTLKLALPQISKMGSGITYIVGENNSGKTTIIEGLFLHNEQKIRSSERQSAGFPCFDLYDEQDSLKRKVTLLREGSYTLVEDPKIQDNDAFEIIPSRRHWHSGVSTTATINAIVNTTIKQTPRAQNSTTHISAALKDIESDTKSFEAFIKFVQRVVPEFSSFAVGFEESEFIEYVTKNGIKHRSDFLGDGVISIIRILAHLFTDKTSPLIIDEPELSLHPLAQKKLFNIIAECSQKRQIIISTHSPYFISWDYIKNGAVLNKVTKPDDQKSEIHTLQPYSVYEKLVKGSNWQQPFLMDVVAKEIFFHDNFLFVEGQEDVGLLKRDNQLIEMINLFGYGVRGKDAFEFALQLAKDLGVKKAGVILDAGQAENTIKGSLEATFPSYKIIQWNKEDIRDKPRFESKEKEGYFNKDGVKKSLEKLDDFDEKIKEVNVYFSQP